MPEQILLAFDAGMKKTGVALGNTLTRQARPLCIIREVTRDGRFRRVAELLEAWRPELVVVGLPLTTQGEEQPASRFARRFANQVHGRFGVPVALVDERGSSLEAQALLGNNQEDDAMAAAVILQRYLDSLK